MQNARRMTLSLPSTRAARKLQLLAVGWTAAAAASLTALFWCAAGLRADPPMPRSAPPAAAPSTGPATDAPAGDGSAADAPAAAAAAAPPEAIVAARLPLEQARDRAGLLHDVYLASLTAMHDRYFHGDRAIVPARAMQDVFAEMERKTGTQARWIGASFKPMNIDHEPKTEFETAAAKRLAKGEPVVETIESGWYRRAGGVSLGGGCLSCHSGFFAQTSPAPKFAGLVISVPVTVDARLPTPAGPESPTTESPPLKSPTTEDRSTTTDDRSPTAQ